jgi:CubicO group peptidase (beta-lactamase class C family)
MINRIITLFVLMTIFSCNPKDSPSEGSGLQSYTPPFFADSAAFKRIESAIPAVEKIYRDYARERNFPSLSFGIVAGGKLIYASGIGLSNIEKQISASPSTAYRIASMSKSFTAMAILKLRDEGKLSLSDPAKKYIPELKDAGQLTADAPDITIQHLLTMSAGFPEDNPWGDRQLDATEEELLATIAKGISFSTAPGTSFEYSNLGFAMLGKIISNVSKVPYQKYITENILLPLGMNSTKWEFSDVQEEKLAKGYQWIDSSWVEIPMLHDGAYGSMGGMISTIEDFTKYALLHLNAWPPRNDKETGSVKRSSIREMHQPWRFNLVGAEKLSDGSTCATATGYGYGLSWSKNCNGLIRVAHSGGLPGFGSEWRIYPEYGIGVVSFSNHTYGAPRLANVRALDTLVLLAGLKPRILPASKILEERKAALMKLLPGWLPADTTGLFADNFFPDNSLSRRRTETIRQFGEIGKVISVGSISAENQLRGSFRFYGEKGALEVFFTLTPQQNALIQQLDITKVQ